MREWPVPKAWTRPPAPIASAQILLARWMGSFEYGTYVYVWTWLLLTGDIVHLGLPLTAEAAGYRAALITQGRREGTRRFVARSRVAITR